MASRGPRFTEEQARQAIADANSWAGALRILGLCTTGGNWRTLKKYAGVWGISTKHFDPYGGLADRVRNNKIPLDKILVRSSTYSRNKLKARLYAEGLKQARCEMCGQGEHWQGRHMALILDHINGVRNDNRIENLRIVCPNCAATLDTHCGRANAGPPPLRDCLRCGQLYRAKHRRQKFCSQYCGVRGIGGPGPDARGEPGVLHPQRRKTSRPPYERLIEEVQRDGFLAVGRRYGVSDNAVRKWILWYEREQARLAGADELPTLGDIRRRYSRRALAKQRSGTAAG